MDSIHTAAAAPASARPTRAKENSPWKQLVADAVLWLVFLTLLTAFRGFLLWNFRTQLGSSVRGEALLRCFTTGLRFDICVATYIVLPSFVLSLIGFWRSLGRWHDRVRRWLTRIVLGLWAVAFVCDTGYFAEYGDQFNSWILGLVYDDRGAIFSTDLEKLSGGHLNLLQRGGCGTGDLGDESPLADSSVQIQAAGNFQHKTGARGNASRDSRPGDCGT